MFVNITCFSDAASEVPESVLLAFRPLTLFFQQSYELGALNPSILQMKQSRHEAANNLPGVSQLISSCVIGPQGLLSSCGPLSLNLHSPEAQILHPESSVTLY